METLSVAQIEDLQAQADGWCVAVYMPTHRAGKEIREDHIRLKNRIADAEKQLRQIGVDDSEIDALCGEVRDLCDMDSEQNREFWRHQCDGLAIFLSADGSRLFKVGQSFDEKTVVAQRFHVKPLLHAVQGDGEYCLLAVSQNDVRFLEGSRSGLSTRPIEELPESLQAVVRGDHQKGFNLHSFRTKANGGENAVPHGHVEKNHEHELARYFRIIDEALNSDLEGDTRPLVFAVSMSCSRYSRST